MRASKTEIAALLRATIHRSRPPPPTGSTPWIRERDKLQVASE